MALRGSHMVIVEGLQYPRPQRAIIHPTPPHFSVEHFISTGKLYGDNHHGMHISSNTRGTSTATSNREYPFRYDIWRSWDDCLWLQQSLEVEYKQAAREKKMRLRQGKGVKGFNGLYKKDLASSWDSLPPGPNPDSVAIDIHKHLPSLTKRGTVFRPSQATIERRQAELIAFVDSLSSDDMPSLIKEIRVGSKAFSEFFGCWERDYELAKLLQATSTIPRKSLTNSLFSSYFSASHPNLPSPNTSSCNSSLKRRSGFSVASLSLSISEQPRDLCKSSCRSRSRPNSSSSDSSAHSESSSDTSLSSLTVPGIANDGLTVSGHNSLCPSDRSNFISEILTDEQEIFSKRPKPGALVAERKANRGCSIFGLSPKKGLLLAGQSGDHRSVRESWQTTVSQDSTMNDLLDELELILPHPIKEQKFRDSIASISTYMTTDSTHAVIPQASPTQTLCSLMPNTRISTPLSLLDLNVYPDADDNNLILDNFPHLVPFISMRPQSRPGTLFLLDSPSSTRTALNPPASPTCSALSSSAFSTTTSTSFSVDSISIKVIHDACIILLRVPRGIKFVDLRQRIYNKFIGQEGIPLSQAYNIAFVPPYSPPRAGACSHPASVTSANQVDQVVAQLIISESDWEQLMSTLQGNKITLCIMDA